EGQPPTASQLINAASCTRDQIGRWCDIYVVATEDSTEHERDIARLRHLQQMASADEVANFLLDVLGEHVAARQEQAATDRLTAYAETVGSRISHAQEQLPSCITAFIAGEPTAAEGDGFFCRAGSESGWLTISFAIGDGTFSYLFAPLRYVLACAEN